MPIDRNKLGDAIGQAIVILPNSFLTFFLNKIFVFKDRKDEIEIIDELIEKEEQIYQQEN
jgi:putative flippase GtrA